MSTFPIEEITSVLKNKFMHKIREKGYIKKDIIDEVESDYYAYVSLKFDDHQSEHLIHKQHKVIQYLKNKINEMTLV